MADRQTVSQGASGIRDAGGGADGRRPGRSPGRRRRGAVPGGRRGRHGFLSRKTPSGKRGGGGGAALLSHRGIPQAERRVQYDGGGQATGRPVSSLALAAEGADYGGKSLFADAGSCSVCPALPGRGGDFPER